MYLERKLKRDRSFYKTLPAILKSLLPIFSLRTHNTMLNLRIQAQKALCLDPGSFHSY